MDYGYEYLTGPEGGAVRRQQPSWKRVCFIIVVLIPYIFIPVTLALWARVDNQTDDVGSCNSVATLDHSSKFSIEKGAAVSFTSSGEIAVGAGTSVYKNIYKADGSCPKYLDLDIVYDNVYVMSSTDGATSITTVTTMLASDARTMSTLTSSSPPVSIYQTTTLAQGTGLIVGIGQDMSADDVLDTVTAASVASTGVITYGESVRYGSGDYSMDPMITRLSDTSFAISYYNSINNFTYTQLLTQYGTVDPVTRAISLSGEVIYAGSTDNSLSHGIVGLSERQYLLLHHTVNDIDNSDGVLSVIIATIDEADESISLSNVTKIASAATFNMRAVRVSDTSALLVYSSATSDSNGATQLTAMMISISGESIMVSASLVLSSGQAADTVAYGLYMDLDVAAMSATSAAASRFAVLYTDATNENKLTLAVIEVTNSNELIVASPDYLLNDGYSDTDDTYAWGALASGSAQQVAIASSLSSLVCDEPAKTRVSMLERLGSPFGIAKNKAKKTDNKVSVMMSGEMSGYSDLVPGAVYYTNTFGELLGGSEYYGQLSTGAVSGYYEDADTETLVSDSEIGVAIGKNKLALH